MNKRGSVAAVILAAGAGTRFGMPKVLAGQGEWLRVAVEALSGGGCDDIVVVLGAAVVDVPAPARAVVAVNWRDGLAASLEAGIRAVDAGGVDAVMLHLVDTPDVRADVVRRVLTAAPRSGLARAVYHGRPGHPVLIARSHWPALLASLRGDEGARAFLRGRDDVEAVECSDLATGVDIDVRR
ncbi:nucleotidyltransferase family protein [Mycobacterium aquaticum]|uniref:Molybdopterin-guanine dinucleotide biosynthesis protein MobA n=1 Tax=Mycobacterium aquaticum TaxID=1927124 RepID=A0A1X0ABC6_9MYCO|nr:nucleotidyltransferase family protein [Mycobacterium aquaticum]ORA27006.1 molybdopterin-guanine dinucleotide biosynthesis protein MobA [Mycobacterium aquaticum]